MFKGIVAFGLKLQIDYFIEGVEERIRDFGHSTEDLKDKPCTIPDTNTRISGGAVQIWNFIRLFPLIMHDKIKDIKDEVSISFLLLSEIVQLVCSPSIS